MATQGGTSRLAQMQMRFQQKQQQEREQRKLEMTGPSKSNLDSTDGRPLNTAVGAGKVRQMFDERRQRSTGIDKSYPLKPIVGRTSTGTATPNVMKSVTTTTTVRKQVGSVKQANGRINVVKQQTTETHHLVNGNGISTGEHVFAAFDSLDNESMPATPDGYINGHNNNFNVPEFAKLSIKDQNKNDAIEIIGDRNNNSNGKSELSGTIKLKPVITKKMAPPMRTTPSPVGGVKVTPRVGQTPNSFVKPLPAASLRPKSLSKTPGSNASSGRSSPSMTPTIQSPIKSTPRPPPAPVPENMEQCYICGRNFNVERIGKHREICQKTSTKKRKVFDVSKQRIQGTEIEQYTRKAPKGASRATAAAAKPAKNAATDKKSNWRRKHEEFIQAIRAAKEMKAYLAKGGKLSDLPPPPPSENPDYVQCPHCQRRFNEGAASRHIPKCATMLHNKPKPGAKPTPKKR